MLFLVKKKTFWYLNRYEYKYQEGSSFLNVLIKRSICMVISIDIEEKCIQIREKSIYFFHFSYTMTITKWYTLHYRYLKNALLFSVKLTYVWNSHFFINVKIVGKNDRHFFHGEILHQFQVQEKVVMETSTKTVWMK